MVVAACGCTGSAFEVSVSDGWEFCHEILRSQAFPKSEFELRNFSNSGITLVDNLQKKSQYTRGLQPLIGDVAGNFII
jgi:hypothetical protein